MTVGETNQSRSAADLIKRDDALAAIYEDSPEWTREAIAALPAIDPAATREAALQALIGELGNSLAWYQMMDAMCSDHVVELTEKLEATEAKLAKAMEALRNTLDKPRDADQSYAGLCSEVMWEIRATLAELEGK